MGKVSQNSANYLIEAELTANGIIEKSDVIGAIFGQTEGLLGEDLDLRELRNKGKVGRMKVELENNSTPTEGTVEISTSLDATDTSILAASLETLEKIGPSPADIKIENVVDVRSSKRDYILKRSKQILKNIRRKTPEKEELRQEVEQEVRESDLSEYEGFKAGPAVHYSDKIILVEGEADVKNLLKNGVKNALALGGTSVPSKIPELVQEREVTAFLDGDRGGDLILEELEDEIDLDFVVRAPEGKEVEELVEREIHELLRDREKTKYAEEPEEGQEEVPEDLKEIFRDAMDDLIGTRAVMVKDEEGETLGRYPLDGQAGVDEGFAVLADGTVDEKLVSVGEKIGAEYVVGRDKSPTVNSSQLRILEEDEL